MNAIKLLCLACVLQMAVPALAKIPVNVSLPKTAKPGEDVQVSVKTDPKAHCKIEAQDAGLTQALNLTDRDADTKGKAAWNFRIPESYKADKMPVIITVSKKGQNAEDKCVNEIEIKK